jgi:hypothetical protein
MSGTTYTWVGDNGNDWVTPENWLVGGVKATAAPNSATATVTHGNTIDARINGAAITVGNLSVVDVGHVLVGWNPGTSSAAGSLTATGAISITSTNGGGGLVAGPASTITTPTLTVGPNAIIGGGGTFNVANLVNSGTIQADGDFFALGPLVITGGTVSGPGKFQLDGSSTLEIASATSQTVLVNTKGSETATLILDSPGSFNGALNLANPNTHLNLFFKGVTPTGATFDAATSSLIITGPGGTIDTIPFVSNGNVAFSTPTSSMAGFGEVSIGTTSGSGAVTAVTASPADAILGAGAAATLTLTLNGPVVVNTTSGTPTLTLNNGGSAVYASGSGTATLTFSYTVGASQDVADLAVTAVNLNGGSVTDPAGNPAPLTGAAVNPAGTLAIQPSAIAAFDTTSNQSVGVVARAYTGPVAGLQGEYVNITDHNLNVAVATANWFIHSGSGQDGIAVSSGKNVLDGGTGSNFLTGGSGTDTFFVDDRGPTADIWSTVNNLQAGDAATIWGVTPQDFSIAWRDGEGAAGFTGLTMHATASGKPTASLTLVGYSQADLSNGRLSVQFSTDPASGSPYMFVQGVS